MAVRPLRRKLASTLAALAVLGLLVVGVTSYAVMQWRATEDSLSRHYTRSVRVQEVRALTFEAFKEVPDTLLGGDQNAREEYVRRRQPVDQAFGEWTALAEDADERAEVEAVRAAAQRLDASAQRVFDLTDAGRRGEAVALLESVEANAFEPFDALTSAAVDNDRRKRAVIREAAARSRRTATLVLAVAGVGVLSLLLLVAAFLSGEVFGPVRRLRAGLAALNAGDTTVRVPQDGDDELAELGREFNALADRLQRSGDPTSSPGSGTGPALDDAALVLGRLIAGVRRQAEQVPGGGQLLGAIDALSVALNRMGALAYPVELRVAPVHPAALLHEVLDRVGDEVVRRSVSTELTVDPDVDALQVDRARLRETLAELVRNALDALPAQGGRLGLRVRRSEDGWTAVEVQDDGSGLSEDDLSWLYDGSAPPQDTRGVGLRLATAVVEQHGGRLQLETLPAGGTTARVLLPPGGRAHDRPDPD